MITASGFLIGVDEHKKPVQAKPAFENYLATIILLKSTPDFQEN
jgi:hypothetical protein